MIIRLVLTKKIGIYERGTGKNANVVHSLLVRQSQGEDVDDELNKALGIFEKNTGFKFKREQGDCLYHTI